MTPAEKPAPASSPDRRFPRGVYAHGTEPDARFSLANERTFLAWIRTSLALMAGGLALEAFSVPIDETLRIVAAGALLALGLAAAVQAWLGWMRSERAMREERPLAPPAIGPVLVVGLIAVMIALAVGLATR
ncbi:YidH family protein [Demequina pelophila]|uniref:YidH family protein n=1 Tax=Demequina pelophila TaxID=1638984 RepID=UPI0007832CAA|nr:DUF202 domain-containing protein [Demequina pelophila]